MTILNRLTQGITQIIYPEVCLSCGHPISSPNQKYVCLDCLRGGFHTPDPQKQAAILPNLVAHRSALWTFDHGGRLQNLLHHLKYHHMADLGFELGQRMGRGFAEDCTQLVNKFGLDPILVPIPLHERKRRKRGYNQARRLALGLADQLEIPLIPIHHVRRKRNTLTQTGFNMRKRLKNVTGAFEVLRDTNLKGRLPIIVDDVFTTGATTFELARTLHDAGVPHCAIYTLAEA
ncbi:MAG: ComF family protein [Bacteroidota bacterium]